MNYDFRGQYTQLTENANGMQYCRTFLIDGKRKVYTRNF